MELVVDTYIALNEWVNKDKEVPEDSWIETKDGSKIKYDLGGSLSVTDIPLEAPISHSVSTHQFIDYIMEIMEKAKLLKWSLNKVKDQAYVLKLPDDFTIRIVATFTIVGETIAGAEYRIPLWMYETETLPSKVWDADFKCVSDDFGIANVVAFSYLSSLQKSFDIPELFPIIRALMYAEITIATGSPDPTEEMGITKDEDSDSFGILQWIWYTNKCLELELNKNPEEKEKLVSYIQSNKNYLTEYLDVKDGYPFIQNVWKDYIDRLSKIRPHN